MKCVATYLRHVGGSLVAAGIILAFLVAPVFVCTRVGVVDWRVFAVSFATYFVYGVLVAGWFDLREFWRRL